jgi:hypothetical protein
MQELCCVGSQVVGVQPVFASVFAAGALLSVVSCGIIWVVAGPASGLVSILLSLPTEMALLWWCVFRARVCGNNENVDLV